MRGLSPECTALLLLRLTFFILLGKRLAATNEFPPMKPNQGIIERLDLLRDGRSDDRALLNEIRQGVKLILVALNCAPANDELPHASPEPVTQGADAPRLRVLKPPPQARSEDRLA